MVKFTVVFVVAILMMSFVAPSLANWTGTITLWDAPRWRDENEDQYHWMKGKITEFEALHPGVKIELVETPWAEMGQRLSVAIAGRAWPDLVPVDLSGAINRQHLEQGVIAALDEYFTEEELADFYPNALDAYRFNDKLYGVPHSLAAHVMMLNLDFFEERGVEPPKDGRWTFDEFVETAKALTFDRDGDGVIDVYGFSTYILSGYYEAWPFFLMDGGVPITEELDFGFDSPEAV